MHFSFSYFDWLNWRVSVIIVGLFNWHLGLVNAVLLYHALSFVLSDNQMVVTTIIGPAKWISPSRFFLAIFGVLLSGDYLVIVFTIIWSNMPEDSDFFGWFRVLDILVKLEIDFLLDRLSRILVISLESFFIDTYWFRRNISIVISEIFSLCGSHPVDTRNGVWNAMVVFIPVEIMRMNWFWLRKVFELHSFTGL